MGTPSTRIAPWRLGLALILAALVVMGAALAEAKRGPRGRPGPQGPRGAQGPKGPEGEPGAIALDYVKSGPFSNDPAKQSLGEATCPGGEHVTGGGVIANGGFGQQGLNSSFPTLDGTGWRVFVDNYTGQLQTFSVFAICAPSSAVSLKAGQVGLAKRGRRGPRGPRGPQGPQGPRGDQGSSTLTLDLPLRSVDAAGRVQTSATAGCANGEQVIGGGASAPGDFHVGFLNSTAPSGTDGWFGAEDRVAETSGPLVVYPICTPKPATGKTAGRRRHALAAKHHHRHGRRGTRGPAGPAGSTGPTGPQGEPGSIPSLALTYVTRTVDNPKNQRTTAHVDCPNGQHATGGGVASFSPWAEEDIGASRPEGGDVGWEVDIDNFGNKQDWSFRIHAICAPSAIPSKR